jgi:hypothetical protein
MNFIKIEIVDLVLGIRRSIRQIYLTKYRY